MTNVVAETAHGVDWLRHHEGSCEKSILIHGLLRGPGNECKLRENPNVLESNPRNNSFELSIS